VKVAAALTALISLLLAGSPAQAARVAGRVLGPERMPVEYATVAVKALKIGVATDDQGRFELELPAGRHSLEVQQLGYQPWRQEVEAGDGLLALEIVLQHAPVPVEEVVVAASSFGKTGKSEGAVIRRADIVTTPGGAADVFQALRALPGINAPNEGAALYVRGGHPRETLIRLDGGEIGHPYHYEGASGGLFSSLDSYMLKSAFFSSGGFGAKYGGVLSGVLDIETQDPLNLKTVSLGANLAGGSVSSSWALVPDRLSLVGNFSHAFPELLFKLYGSASEFETAPSSSHGFAKLLHRYSSTGRLTLGYLEAHDYVGIRSDYLNVRHVYGERAANRLALLQLQDVALGRVALRGHVSGQRYWSQWSFGPFGAFREERVAQLHLDGVWPISERHELSGGVQLRGRETEIAGYFAADSTDLDFGAPIRLHDSHPVRQERGFYLEDKARVWGPVYATLGVRFDHLSRPAAWTADPRAALAWRMDGRQTLRVAAGRYHQPPDAEHLDRVYGNPDLGPLRADHVIAGYEWKSEFGNVRVEAFRKDYRDLVTQDLATFYANGGHGVARGVDAFLQGTYRRLSGWLSYGYLDARRKELDDPEEVPASYGVKHSLTLVAQCQATSSLQVGARYTGTTGRPFTPVVSRTYDPGRNLYRPVYGDHNSGRMPEYHRLDVRLTKLFSIPAAAAIPASSVCAFYVEGINVLDIGNVLDYVYAPDYSARYRRESYFSRRLLVAGVALSW
jgi:vitamin B12 transporter